MHFSVQFFLSLFTHHETWKGELCYHDRSCYFDKVFSIFMEVISLWWVYLEIGILILFTPLYQVDDTEVISFLLSTEIIPLCLRTMEMGSELSKTVECPFLFFHFFFPSVYASSDLRIAYCTGSFSYCLSLDVRYVIAWQKVFFWQVATFIVQKILLDDVGLDYICTTAERFFAVGRVLGTMVASLAEQHSSRLLKHIIRCYLRLSDNARLVKWSRFFFSVFNLSC